ncbi:MAG: S8 family serine peptidase [Chloroflexota bacterium]
MKSIKYGVLTTIILLFSMEFSVQANFFQDETPDAGNCAITIDGQKWHISGGTGGITTNLPGTPVDFDVVEQDITASFVNVQGNLMPDFGSDPTAILIADDFTGESPESVFSEAEDDKSLDKHNVSHGEMVYQHVERLVKGVLIDILKDRLLLIEPENQIGLEETVFRTLPSIHIVKVDTQNYNTQKITDNLSAVIDKLKAEGIHRFAINYSFVIFPCNIVNDFLTSYNDRHVTSFQDYIDNLMKSGQIQNFEKWLQDQIDLVNQSNDPLLAFMTNLTEGRDKGVESIVFVASSGNYGKADDQSLGVSFPLLPGGWNQVIAVSGLEGDDISARSRKPWLYANPGEIVAPAAWYPYLTPDDIPTKVYYAGTSFAAPVITVVAAFHLSATNIVCPLDRMPTPLLNYDKYQSLKDIPTINELVLGRRLILGGVQGKRYCPPF